MPNLYEVKSFFQRAVQQCLTNVFTEHIVMFLSAKKYTSKSHRSPTFYLLLLMTPLLVIIQKKKPTEAWFVRTGLSLSNCSYINSLSQSLGLESAVHFATFPSFWHFPHGYILVHGTWAGMRRKDKQLSVNQSVLLVLSLWSLMCAFDSCCRCVCDASGGLNLLQDMKIFFSMRWASFVAEACIHRKYLYIFMVIHDGRAEVFTSHAISF